MFCSGSLADLEWMVNREDKASYFLPKCTGRLQEGGISWWFGGNQRLRDGNDELDDRLPLIYVGALLSNLARDFGTSMREIFHSG